ncbi:hypothetical protein CAEBREN_03198 [Caenorhabditis brenneri]|uniref:HTH CENPB-type domain-containing protein n=1 Tax=Caenorhabditis brenneri TaxID=135651 RepID=G0N3N4_CAEBE|nr:hypothetical protein CAEBREN_03198 [Caenorhabditis brenneri]
MGKHRWAKKPKTEFTTKKQPENRTDDENVLRNCAQVLQVAGRELARGKSSKAIKQAKDILIAATEKEADLNRNDDSDNEIFDPENRHENDEKYLYSSSQWRKIIRLRDVEKWPLKRIIHYYRKLGSIERARRYISRKREELKSVRRTKMSLEDFEHIDKEVAAVIKKLDEESEFIHDDIISEIAMRAAKKIGKKFHPSANWVLSFKKRHKLCSRHIDVLVSNKKIEDSDKLRKSIDDFRKKNFSEMKKRFADDNVYNIDQTGIKLEPIGGRTITLKGRKRCTRKIQRPSALTHSITLHIAISAGGKLFPKTFLVLHEKKLPRKFSTIRNKFKYLEIRNTSSGLMNSNLAIDWVKNVFLPKIPKKCALLCDSWNGFDKMKRIPAIKRKKLFIDTIPPGTTSQLQPLDLFFNKQIKEFMKRMSNQIRLYHKKFAIAKRGNLLALYNLMLSRFSAPMFCEMIKMAWFRSGYSTAHPKPFSTPAKFCFTIPEDKLRCDNSRCRKESFILCAHCRKTKCFSHGLQHIH